MHQALERVHPPEEEGPSPVSWGDPATLRELLGPHGDLAVSERELLHETTTPEEVWDRWERMHPMWLAARKVLEPAGEWDGVRADTITALGEAGLQKGARSPYLLAVLHRA